MRKLFWELTKRCNLRCKHCALHNVLTSPHTIPADELGTEECLKIADQLDEANLFFIEVVGAGEPFVRSDILEILRYLGEKRFLTRVTTNGTLIDNETAENLASIRMKGVSVSLENSIPEINDSIRGKGSFKRALRGINYLRDYGIPFRIQMTVNKMNYKDIDGIVKFCFDLDAEAVSLLHYYVCPSTNPFAVSLNLGREEFFLAAKRISELKKEYPKFISSDLDSNLRFLSPELKDTCTDERFVRCRLMEVEMTILHNGDVIPCPYMRDRILGNLMNIHLSEIQHLPAYQEIRELVKLTVDEANEQCRACEWRYVCGGGCRGQAYFLTGDILAPDPRMCLLAKGENYDYATSLYNPTSGGKADE